MPKQTVEFPSPIDALVAVTKRLARFEAETGLESAAFFASYNQGQQGDDARAVEWANDYRHFLALRADLAARLHEAA